MRGLFEPARSRRLISDYEVEEAERGASPKGDAGEFHSKKSGVAGGVPSFSFLNPPEIVIFELY